MKVALVHDDFTQQGGAENLFATIAAIYPKAPIYTSLVNWNKLPSSINRERIKTSFMQKIPFAGNFYKLLFPLYPLAFESFDFSKYDLVISSTTRFAKGIITTPNTIHVCYINSIPRFLWHDKSKKSYYPKFLIFLIKPFLFWLKTYDKVAASRPDFYIANSQNVASYVQKFYAYPSKVVYPFADLNFFTPAKVHNWELKSQNYFLIVSRLVKWKKIDIAIKAIEKTQFKLKIVGSGTDESRLEELSGEKVEFLGKVSLEDLKELYQNSLGLVVTQEEDFGISMVEAQACGIPVIAYNKGGQTEIVKNGKTGVLYEQQTENSLKDAIIHASNVKWSLTASRRNAERFSERNFVINLKRVVDLYAK